MKPTNEQVREFWEWCGVRPEKVYEQLSFRGGSYYLKYPELDLNNLFKYAGPKLLDEGWDIMISYNQEFKTWDVELSHPTKQAILEQKTTLVTALFWAIWEVIHKGNDET